jgi:hypothetical protein
VCDNQLAYLPFARSGRAQAVLFDKYPELAERIEQGRRAKIDSIVLSNKFSDGDGPAYSSFRAQSLDELSMSPLKQRTRRRASREGKPEAHSPMATPALKGKGSMPDLMFEMSDAEEEDELETRIPPPQFSSSSAAKLPSAGHVESPRDSWPDVRRNSRTLSHDLGINQNANISPMSPLPNKPLVERTPGQPWGSTPLPGTKLDLKDIMAQTPNDKPSNLSLGLSQQEKEQKAAASFQAKLSQKERKKLQQAQLLGQPATIAKPQPAPPTVSPWQVKSHIKPSMSPAISPGPQPGSQPARTSSTPHLTMRQTVANRGAAPKTKEQSSSPQASRTVSGSAPSSQNRPTPSSERGMSVSTTPIPTPHSVRHIPLPTHSPTSPSQHLSMQEILSLQEAEKTYIRDAAAKRSLQEIQQEQEFQQWWDEESKRVIQEEEQRRRADERAAKASRGRGKSRGGRGRGKGKESKEGDGGDVRGKGSRDVSAPAAAPEASSSSPVPKKDGGDRGRGRGKGPGHRGGRGGGRGGKPSGPIRDGSATAVSTPGPKHQPGAV